MRRRINSQWADSVLDLNTRRRGENTSLTIKIRVFLEPYRPDGGIEIEDEGERSQVRLVSWDSSEFQRWKWEFKQVVEENWNNKLWIVPDRFWGVYTVPPSTYDAGEFPNVECRLRIHHVSEASHAHLHAVVARLHDDDRFRRSSMIGPDCGGRMASFFRAQGKLDDRDLQEKEPVYGQIPVVHEMGHYLGLDHVWADRAGMFDNTNDDEYYGAQGTDDARDLMGRGMTIRGWHAHFWRRRIRDHIHPHHSVNWRGTTQRPRPVSLPPTYAPRRRGPLGPGGV